MKIRTDCRNLDMETYRNILSNSKFTDPPAFQGMRVRLETLILSIYLWLCYKCSIPTSIEVTKPDAGKRWVHSALWSPCKQAIAHTSLEAHPGSAVMATLASPLQEGLFLPTGPNGLPAQTSWSLGVCFSEMPTMAKRTWSSLLMKFRAGKPSVTSPKSTS